MKPKGSGDGGCVLVVDDHPTVRRTIGKLLKDKFEIVTAASAREARAALSESRFDLVLLDIDLGKGKPTGLDCLRWLPDVDHKGAVCMLTGYLSPELLHEALLLGADDYLSKIGSYSLLAEIARLVELGRLPRAERPQYATIANPGLLRSLRLTAKQIDLLVEMVEQGFPRDGELAEALGVGAKALAERLARIEARFGATSRRQLVRYLDALAGYVRRSQLDWGSGWIDLSLFIGGAMAPNLPRGWGH